MLIFQLFLAISLCQSVLDTEEGFLSCIENLADESLLSYYPLKNDVRDWSGSENHGQIIGNPNFDLNYGIQLDGESDIIAIPTPNTTESITISMFINRPGPTAYNELQSGFFGGQLYESGGFQLLLSESDKLYMNIHDYTSDITCGTQDFNYVAVDTWQHIMAVYDNEDGFFYYMNGQLDIYHDCYYNCPSLSWSDWNDVRIGCVDETNFFYGSIRNVLIFNTAISSTGAGLIYECGISRLYQPYPEDDDSSPDDDDMHYPMMSAMDVLRWIALGFAIVIHIMYLPFVACNANTLRAEDYHSKSYQPTDDTLRALYFGGYRLVLFAIQLIAKLFVVYPMFMIFMISSPRIEFQGENSYFNHFNRSVFSLPFVIICETVVFIVISGFCSNIVLNALISEEYRKLQFKHYGKWHFWGMMAGLPLSSLLYIGQCLVGMMIFPGLGSKFAVAGYIVFGVGIIAGLSLLLDVIAIYNMFKEMDTGERKIFITLFAINVVSLLIFPVISVINFVSLVHTNYKDHGGFFWLSHCGLLKEMKVLESIKQKRESNRNKFVSDHQSWFAPPVVKVDEAKRRKMEEEKKKEEENAQKIADLRKNARGETYELETIEIEEENEGEKEESTSNIRKGDSVEIEKSSTSKTEGTTVNFQAEGDLWKMEGREPDDSQFVEGSFKSRPCKISLVLNQIIFEYHDSNDIEELFLTELESVRNVEGKLIITRTNEERTKEECELSITILDERGRFIKKLVERLIEVPIAPFPTLENNTDVGAVSYIQPMSVPSLDNFKDPTEVYNY